MARDPQKPDKSPSQTQGPAEQGQSELEETDLFVTMLKARDWWRRHGHWVLLVILVVVAAWAGKRWYDATQHRQQTELHDALALENDPARLQQWAEDVDNPNYRARFLIRAGEVLEQQAGGPFDRERDEEAIENLEQAQALYLRGAEIDQINPTWRINFLIRAAVVAEKLGDWDEAERLHAKVAEEADERRPQIARRARANLERIEWLREGVPVAAARGIDRFSEEDMLPRVEPSPSWRDPGREPADDPSLPIPGAEKWHTPFMMVPDHAAPPLPADEEPAPDPQAMPPEPAPGMPPETPPGMAPDVPPGEDPGADPGIGPAMPQPETEPDAPMPGMPVPEQPQPPDAPESQEVPEAPAPPEAPEPSDQREP